MSRLASRLVALLILASAIAPVAHTQHPAQRKGFWLSAGLGAGSLGCEGCSGRSNGLAGQLALGATITPKLQIGIASNDFTKSGFGYDLSVVALTATARYYPSATGRFFLTGGLGIGSVGARLDGAGNRTRNGLGLLLGLGYDIRVSDMVSITPFYNGFVVGWSTGSVDVGQFGLSVTMY